jgi:hypothetical protein
MFRLRAAHSRTAERAILLNISRKSFHKLATRSFGNYQARIVFLKKLKLTVEVEIAKLQVINHLIIL